jgi:hypothetical protein
MSELRLGDVIDDYCVKCRRLTNHSIVSIVDTAAAKVRCRTCYSDHDYRHEIAPPTKKELKKQELFKEVLAAIDPNAVLEDEDVAEHALETDELPVDLDEGLDEVEPEAPEPAPVPVEPVKAKKTRGKARQ